jgi:hypothetical protein
LYDPPNAGVALDAVEKALHAIVNTPHLSKAQLVQARRVSEDVEGVVAYLETAEGKKLSKEARAAKVSSSIKELQDLQGDWQKAATKMISTHKDDLMKQLKAKEAELAKDTKMMKVLNLEKALAEKKLKLQKLIDAKTNAAAQKAGEKEAAKQQEMLAKVLDTAKTVKESKAPAKPIASDKLKIVQSYLEGRVRKTGDALAKLNADEDKKEAEIKGLADKKMPANAPAEVKKSQGVLKMLMKQERRQFLKARAPLQAELRELNQAVGSIKKGDVKSLSKVMSHMQGEMKTLQAKSHKFLY